MPFQREPGLIGQALRGGGLDTLQPGSISQLLQMLVANSFGVLSVRSWRGIMLRRSCFLHIKCNDKLLFEACGVIVVPNFISLGKNYHGLVQKK